MLIRCLLAVLFAGFAVQSTLAAEPPKKLLLIGCAPDNHPPGTHEYLPAMDLLAKLLKPVSGIEATVVKADPAWKDGPELIGRSRPALRKFRARWHRKKGATRATA